MININNVSFCYQNTPEKDSVRNVNLQIKAGEVVLLCGESGCGKTTVTRLINGLIPHYFEGSLHGDVIVDNKNVSACQLYEFADKIGSVFQNPRSQFFSVDTESELAFGCENLGLARSDIEQKVKTTVETMNLQRLLGKSLFALSGGEKQKIACGSASTLSPDIFVLDEPTSNLDLSSIDALADILKLWKKQGKTIVIAEHRIYFLKEIVDRVIYMKDGEIEKEFFHDDFYGMSDEESIVLGLRGINKTVCEKESYETDRAKSFTLCNFIHCYGKQKALNVDKLKLPKNQIIGIVGHNGAGKSTLSRCLCGLEKGCKGTVEYETLSLKRKKRLSSFFLVMQDVNHQLFTESVLDEVMLSMPEEDEARAEEILSSLDLLQYKETHPQALSGGQKQRVAIASAVASQRDFIIFDEPTSGLDYRHMLEVAENIKKLKQQGKTIFVVTHDTEFLNTCCDCVVSLERGCIQ